MYRITVRPPKRSTSRKWKVSYNTVKRTLKTETKQIFRYIYISKEIMCHKGYSQNNSIDYSRSNRKQPTE